MTTNRLKFAKNHGLKKNSFVELVADFRVRFVSTDIAVGL